MDIYYPADLYADTRTTCIALFRSLSAEQSVTVVPLNPEWRVVDVAAHVCGIVDDVLHGNVAGLGSDAWTEAQVAKRAGMSLSEVCDEAIFPQELLKQHASCLRPDGWHDRRKSGRLQVEYAIAI